MQSPQDFFSLLYKNVPPEYIAELRFIPEGGGNPTRLYRPASYLPNGNFEALEAINQHSHVYHRIALSLEKRSRKQDICLVTALWMDIDGKTDELFAKIENHYYPPTMLIDSGGGWHLYWLLKNPVALTNDRERFEFERTMQGLILDFAEDNADKHVKDCTRILRTPFYRNIKEKYAPDFPSCSVVWADDSDGDRYHFDWFYKRYAPLGAPPAPTVRRDLPILRDGKRPKWIEDYLASGIGEGSRNQRLFVVARYFNDIGDKSAQAEQDLMSRALADGLSQHEAMSTIRSAWSQTPNPSNGLPSHMKRLMQIEDSE